MKFQISKPDIPYLLDQFGGAVMGHEYRVTNRYLTRDGKPYIYRMGEMHFSRVAADDWEFALLQMKEGGIEIVSSYLFWLHHEEVEGVFDFSGNRDLHRFCEACKKVGMPFFLRIGPWAHGEARNGGFPDWLLERCGGKEHTRCNKEPYLTYVRRYFSRVFEEIKDLIGDVVVGIQVENELHRNAAHMETLRSMMLEIGFRASIWTATGWGPSGTGADLPNELLLPVYGAYPETPWVAHTDAIQGNDTFHFKKDWNSANIGTDIFGTADGFTYETTCRNQQQVPYLTCEVGGGNQVTYHRRPIISAEDVAAGVICRLGSGANGIGYYMYRGGRNPIGRTTMQESRASGYKNDYPIVSYDFQAPIGESGLPRRSHHELKTIHDFLDACGEMLAPMPSYLPDQVPKDLCDKKILRCAVRSDGEKGFFFFNNHAHAEEMKDLHEEICIELAKCNQKTRFDLDVLANTYGIIPFRFPLGDEIAEWITAIPVSISKNEIVFEEIQGIEPKIRLTTGKDIPFTSSMIIGGVSVRLRKKAAPKDPVGILLPIHRTQKSGSASFASHIQNRDGSKIETVRSNCYEFSLPLEARYLSIEAIGNVAAIYNGDALITDYYLYGDKWIIDIKDIPHTTVLTLEIVPLTEQNKQKIYFETDMPIGDFEPKVYMI